MSVRQRRSFGSVLRRQFAMMIGLLVLAGPLMLGRLAMMVRGLLVVARRRRHDLSLPE